MTITEYITRTLSRFNVPASDVELILIEAGINGDDTFTQENKDKVKLALYNGVPLIIAGLSEISEGDYTVKYNLQGLKDWYALLAAEVGETNSLSVGSFRDRSNMW